MAYVFGFFAADGNLTKGKRGNHYIEFTSCDRDLLEEIRYTIDSNHKITARKRNKKHKISYRLQIGSKTMFNDLMKRGLTPNKSKTIKLPTIPDRYVAHFTRGFFDGDGNIMFGYFRKTGRTKKSKIILTRFTSGSKSFLRSIKERLTDLVGLNGSLLYYSDAWRLQYSIKDSKSLFNFMYKNGDIENLIYLKRKYNIYLEAGVAQLVRASACHAEGRRFESGHSRPSINSG